MEDDKTNSEIPEEIIEKSEPKRNVDGWKTKTTEKSDTELVLAKTNEFQKQEDLLNEKATVISNYLSLKSKYNDSLEMKVLFEIHDERLEKDKKLFFEKIGSLEKSIFEIQISKEKDERVLEAKPKNINELESFRVFLKEQDKKNELALVNSTLKERTFENEEDRVIFGFNTIREEYRKKIRKQRQGGQFVSSK